MSAVVQYKSAVISAGSTVTVTLNSATTAGNLVVFCVAGDGAGQTVTGCVNGAENATQAASARATESSGLWTDVWYILSCAGGSTSCVATLSVSGGADKWLFIIEVSGLSGAAFDVAAFLSNQAAVANVATGAAATTTSADGFGIGLIFDGSIAANPKAGNEFTSGGEINSGSVAIVSLISGSAATHTPQWSTNAATPAFCTSTVFWKAAGGGGASPLRYNSDLNGIGASGPFFRNPLN